MVSSVCPHLRGMKVFQCILLTKCFFFNWCLQFSSCFYYFCLPFVPDVPTFLTSADITSSSFIYLLSFLKFIFPLSFFSSSISSSKFPVALNCLIIKFHVIPQILHEKRPTVQCGRLYFPLARSIFIQVSRHRNTS